MKKTFRIVAFSLMLALLVPFATLNAQIFDKGDMVLSTGLGLGSTYIGGWNSYYKISVPPIFVAGDYCIREDLGPGNLGVGGILAYSAYKYHYNYGVYDYGSKYSTFIIGARGTYHFVDLVDKLDLYGGVVIGAKILTHKEFGDYQGSDYSYNNSGVVYDLFAGARYYFTDNLGVMGELGYGISWLKIGISLKL
jgi:hypothetical protein